jgi:hypothetical protein
MPGARTHPTTSLLLAMAQHDENNQPRGPGPLDKYPVLPRRISRARAYCPALRRLIAPL